MVIADQRFSPGDAAYGALLHASPQVHSIRPFVARVPGGFSRGRCTLRRRSRYYQLCRCAARRYLKMGRAVSAGGARNRDPVLRDRGVAPMRGYCCCTAYRRIGRGPRMAETAFSRKERYGRTQNPAKNQSRGRGAYSSTRMLFSMLTLLTPGRNILRLPAVPTGVRISVSSRNGAWMLPCAVEMTSCRGNVSMTRTIVPSILAARTI